LGGRQGEVIGENIGGERQYVDQEISSQIGIVLMKFKFRVTSKSDVNTTNI
jgi:hypothetical protein